MREYYLPVFCKDESNAWLKRAFEIPPSSVGYKGRKGFFIPPLPQNTLTWPTGRPHPIKTPPGGFVRPTGFLVPWPRGRWSGPGFDQCRALYPPDGAMLWPSPTRLGAWQSRSSET